MLINQLALISDGPAAQTIELAFRDPDSSMPYQVMGLTGLDADEITFEYAGGVRGGPKLYLPSAKEREVVALLGLNPWVDEAHTFSSLRDAIYRLVGGGGSSCVTLDFRYDGDSVATVTGFVSKIEPSLFTETPQIQLTIRCKDDPLLRGPTVEVDVETQFNEGVLTLSDNVSTAAHGFRAWFQVTDASSFVTIETVGVWKFTLNHNFWPNEFFCVSTEHAAKELFKTGREKTKESYVYLADKVEANSFWPMIFPGDNEIRVSAARGVSVTSMTYRTAFWGV